MRKDVLPMVVRAMKTSFIQPQKSFGRRDTRLRFQDSFPVFIRVNAWKIRWVQGKTALAPWLLSTTAKLKHNVSVE